MKTCFVIQPFDRDKFDKRYTDVFEPAIKNSGFIPYRVDKDDAVTIPIEDIEQKIKESDLCFAEITTDNPNVWYELGYAFACGKNIVMVCSEERLGKFPFDIQHKFIITYKTASISDFNDLSQRITNKIKALENKIKTIEVLSNIPVQEIKGLKNHEFAILVLLMENTFSKQESFPVHMLKTEMNKSGFNDMATSVGIRSLEKLQFVSVSMEVDQWSEYPVCRLNENGENWILDNQDKLDFKMTESFVIQHSQEEEEEEEEDLPF
ncbi:hypothetical protein [Chryseobacterium sp. GP-SGM7]|uniref:hypothetical protein n=1 Tax=Chryseobacterium sp. GP-SGM7 TaxID=3411323 RepID=UPI003B924764